MPRLPRATWRKFHTTHPDMGQRVARWIDVGLRKNTNLALPTGERLKIYQARGLAAMKRAKHQQRLKAR
jgi:hypothetical protein